MKKITKILSAFLAIAMLAITGCKPNSSNGDSSAGTGENIGNVANVGEDGLPLPEGSEATNVQYTNYDFVVNSKSDYAIVIPQNYTEFQMMGAQEINTFLYKSCGVTLEIKFDNQVEYSKDSKFIVIGNTALTSHSNISASKSELGNYGFVLKTVDKSIFIVDASFDGKGALNGVYEFLHHQLGWTIYSYDEIAFNTFSSAKLVDVNVVDKPDVPGYIGSAYIGTRQEFRDRLRTTERVQVLGNGSVTPYHNMLVWLPTHVYYADHPLWYNSVQSQICLTAHGDEEEYQALVNTVFNLMYKEVMTYDLEVVTWTLMDNWDPCDCAACKEVDAYYGARSGQLVKFCNTLSDMFAARFEEEGIDKNLSILFFAYYYYTAPPKADLIQCNDNVYPIIAPYNEMDRAASIYSDKNANIRGIIDGWDELCERFAFWIYSVNFQSYFVPFDPFSALQENYAYFASKNPIYLYDEGFSGQYAENVPGFTGLKEYLSAAVAWDTGVNISNLTADFFRNYYKDAAEDMYAYYTEYRMKLLMLFEKYDYTHNLAAGDCFKSEYFEYGTLLSWKNHIDNAYKKIEKYKDTDPELYQKLDVRIRTEGLMPKYLIWKLHSAYYTLSERNAMVDDILRDCDIICMLTGTHWRPIENAIKK